MRLRLALTAIEEERQLLYRQTVLGNLQEAATRGSIQLAARAIVSAIGKTSLLSDNAVPLQRQTTTRVADATTQIIAAIYPWLNLSKSANGVADAAKLQEMWKKIYGDPDDPAVREKYEKTLAYLRR